MPSLAGQTLDKYEMLDEVGHGGMAVVYRGIDTVLDREVAVKVLHSHLADREESRLRLRREALTVAKVRHENIVEIYDYSGPEADESYIVMEFVHGTTLRDWLDDRFKPRPAIAALIVQRLCVALECAHAHGVVHRDLKPENVMIREDGCLKLMDFGIAQILDHQKLTMTGQLLGSPAYMAPELISGKPVDKRTDLFAIGIILYLLSTGELPFSGRNPHEVLNRIADAEYTRPSSVNPLVDGDLEAIIDRALARNPSDRYQSAESLASELGTYLESLGVEPGPGSLRAYFTNPDNYLVDLDSQVCSHLLGRAQTAATSGNSARALKLLARVVELDPNNKQAQSLLETVKRRGRRMRQLLVGGGAVALTGLLFAAAVLARNQELPEADRIGTADPEPKGRKNAARTVIPVAAEDAGVNETEAAGAAGDGQETAGPAETGATGTAAETGEAKTTGGGARPNRKLECAVEVKNIPLVQRTEYKVKVGDKGSVSLPRKDTAFSFTFPRDQSSVMLTLAGGLRHEGSKRVTESDCRGSDPIVLQAQPKDATIKLVALPEGVREDNVIIECISGCTLKTKPAKFRLGIEGGKGFRKVELKFFTGNIAGSGVWRSKSKSIRLNPGPNQVNPQLQLD